MRSEEEVKKRISSDHRTLKINSDTFPISTWMVQMFKVTSVKKYMLNYIYKFLKYQACIGKHIKEFKLNVKLVHFTYYLVDRCYSSNVRLRFMVFLFSSFSRSDVAIEQCNNERL